jgi:BASS family bile acid:Na+ symporter
MHAWSRPALVVAALLAGAALPQLAPLAWLLRWLLMLMLLSAFLDLPWRRPAAPGRVALLVMAPWPLAGLAWLACVGLSRELALAVALAAAAPTATAAPVMVGLLRGDLAFITAVVLASNLVAAVLLPLLLLPAATGSTAALVPGLVATVLVPLALAALLRLAWPAAPERLRPLRAAVFPAWCGGLVLAAASASAHLQASPVGLGHLAAVAIASGVLCVCGFALGRRLGGAGHGDEGAQALGQKNTMLAISFALAAGAPGAALGPTCYVLWHNLANAWQLARRRPEKTLSASARP